MGLSEKNSDKVTCDQKSERGEDAKHPDISERKWEPQCKYFEIKEGLRQLDRRGERKSGATLSSVMYARKR